MNLRDEPPYTDLLRAFDTALEKIGYNGKIDDLIGNLNVSALEELMLASYRMMKFLRWYLKNLKAPFKEQLPIIDLYTAIQQAVIITHHKWMQPLDDEAAAMERVSRACYAWMRSYRLIRDEKPKLSPIEQAELEFNKLTAPKPASMVTYKFKIEYIHHGHYMTDTVWETSADAARTRFLAQNGNLELDILRVT